MFWFQHALKRSFKTSGRASRKAYWLFVLMSVLVAIPFSFVDGLLGRTQLVPMLYWIVILPAWVSVTVRRLHDTDRSGGWLLCFMVPVLGWLYLFLMMIEGSDPDHNEYGRPSILESN